MPRSEGRGAGGHRYEGLVWGPCWAPGPAQEGDTLSASEQFKGSGAEGEYNYLQEEMHEPLEAGALICPR